MFGYLKCFTYLCVIIINAMEEIITFGVFSPEGALVAYEYLIDGKFYHRLLTDNWQEEPMVSGYAEVSADHVRRIYTERKHNGKPLFVGDSIGKNNTVTFSLSAALSVNYDRLLYSFPFN